tara:strand:- start:2184 stop:3284 length:1101 start_codon:yes stop_codon:yes gene_type:complete
MNVVIIGNNLTSLTLANALVNNKVGVTLFSKFKLDPFKTDRCIGITLKNLIFFEKEVSRIEKKYIMPIDEIGIFLEKNHTKETLNFKKKDTSLLHIIKISNLIKILKTKIKKNKLFLEKKINNKNFYEKILKDHKYDLIFNCEKNNYFIKKYFYQKHQKDYKSIAFTCIINHAQIKNNKAIQIFTKYGPLAFLPLSKIQTSVVFSMYNQKEIYDKKKILNIIKAYNNKYVISKTSNIEKAKLKFSSVRRYSAGKILLFGDELHQIHPLAGQGFNMTIRDLSILINLIKKKKELGLNLDKTTIEEFEKKTKHYNFLYSNGINLLQDFFKLDSKNKNKITHKLFGLIGKNKFFNKIFMNMADQGINIH